MSEEPGVMNERAGAAAGARPRVLVLTSDALFPHFFPAHVLARLEQVGEWEHFNGREDSAELRGLLSRSDAVMTTWHSPFLRMEMLGSPRRERLIAHCGGELKARRAPEVVRDRTGANAPGPMAAPVEVLPLPHLFEPREDVRGEEVREERVTRQDEDARTPPGACTFIRHTPLFRHSELPPPAHAAPPRPARRPRIAAAKSGRETSGPSISGCQYFSNSKLT
jgi:hypothetical protein